MGTPKTSKKSRTKLLKLIKMSQQEEQNQKKIQELEIAKSKLSDLIDKLHQNPSLSDEEMEEIAGGVDGGGSDTNKSCPITNLVC
jgi:hypothetical protein